jgi:hypothetical protein
MRDQNYRPELGKTGVMRACLDVLEVYRVWHQRMNSGAVKLLSESGKSRMFRAARKGTADILATPFPRRTYPAILWIECKSSTGKQRPEQSEFQKEVVLAGHEYIVVNDAQQLIDWLKERGVTR